MNDRTTPLLVAALLMVGGMGSGTAQEMSPDSARTVAAELLAGSPLVKDSMTVVEEAAFVARVTDFLSAADRPDSAVDVDTGIGAARALENFLAPDSIALTLESDPPGFRVRFFRITEGPQRARVVVTDTVLRLPAGLYRIGFLNAVTGETRMQGRACLADCRIRWRY